MELSINFLVQQVEAYLFERETRRYRAAAGLEQGFSWQALLATAPELTRADSVQYVDELIQSPRTDETRRERLKLLRDFLRSLVLEHATAAARDQQATLERETFVVTPSKTYALDEALHSLVTTEHRDTRATLSKETAKTLSENAGPLQQRIDAAGAAAQRLGAPSLLDAWPRWALEPKLLDARLANAAQLIKATDDAYRDVLAFALKRIDSNVKPQHAALHDVERALSAPWLFEHFRREDVWHAVTRCLGDMSLAPNAQGRIVIDQDAGPKRRGAHVFTPKAPDEVRLVVDAAAGFSAWSAWLDAWGTAQFHANIGRAMPVVERVLGDDALPLGFGRLFSSFLGSAGWLKRYAGLNASQSIDAARLYALRELCALRFDAAMVAVEVEVAKGTQLSAALEDGAQRVSAAVHADVAQAFVLHRLEALGARVARLDAASFEAAVHGQLQQHFNEDYWRNPGTGRFLANLAQKGRAGSALLAAKAFAPLTETDTGLGAAAARRVTVMNA